MKNKVFLIGNAHLDPVWLWRKTEGFAEIKSTFRSALDRMNEFPDYIFTASSASYYKWIYESEPEMFEEIKQRVAEGRWILAGGLWVQPDCNLPSGEAFARHMLYSQRFYMEKFGKIAEFGYNVDSFGHNGMLPQLLKHGGMNAYVFMRPDNNENPGLPIGLFNWESPDGSTALTFRLTMGYGDDSFSAASHPEYVGLTNHEAKALEMKKTADKLDIPLMSYYGVGNHGGGPTVRHISALEKVVNESGGAICFAGPGDYFEHVRKAVDAAAIPAVQGDLQHHASGCYAANSTVKQKNRKTENTLITAEKYDWLSNRLTGSKLNTKEFATAWEKVMFNQFHDILAGCSIRSAYEEAYNSFGFACDTAWEAGNFAMQKISWRVNTKALFNMPGKENGAALFADNGEGEPSVVFNPHSFPVKAPAYIPYVSTGVCDDQGRPVPFQTVRAERTNGTDKFETLIMADVPALGWATNYAYRRSEPDKQIPSTVSADEDTLENDLVRIEFDRHTGWIKSYFDKSAKKELAQASFAKPILIRDDQTDTWSHRVFEFREEIGAFTDAKLTVIEEGPLRAAIRVESFYNNSKLTQNFTLYADSKELEVRGFLDFGEQFKILKLSFPVTKSNGKVTYSMPYGFITKPANGEEEHSHRWIDVSDDSGAGIALLNDGKYSFDVLGNDMHMSVARGCGFADHFGIRDDRMQFQDQGEQFFNYVLMPHDTADFAPVVKRAALLNQPLDLIRETHHEGPFGTGFEGIEISADNCIAEAMKQAEEGTGTIVRLYETAGRQTTAKVEIPLLNTAFVISFKPQEIKTFLISDSTKEVKEVNFLEM